MSLATKWNELPSNARLGVVVAGVFGTVLLVSVLVVGTKPERTIAGQPIGQNRPANFRVPTKAETGIADLAAKLESFERTAQQIDSRMKRLEADRGLLFRQLQQMRGVTDSSGATVDFVDELQRLSREMDALRFGQPSTTVPTQAQTPDGRPLLDPDGQPVTLPGLAPTVIGSAPAQVQVTTPPRPTLRVVGAPPPPQENVRDAKPSNPVVAYLPMGSQFEGVLLNGMDVPTSTAKSKDPVPAVLRVKTDAILPNHFSHNVRECFVIISGFGDLSSERALMRTEGFSCVRDDGSVIEGPIEGYVVGDDGRVGIKGVLVSKQGQMIAQSLTAGFLGGIAKGLQPWGTPSAWSDNTSKVGDASTFDMSSVLQAGAMSGASSAANQVASFYLEMARETFPVVEIDAARRATIVLTKGLEIK